MEENRAEERWYHTFVTDPITVCPLGAIGISLKWVLDKMLICSQHKLAVCLVKVYIEQARRVLMSAHIFEVSIGQCVRQQNTRINVFGSLHKVTQVNFLLPFIFASGGMN